MFVISLLSSGLFLFGFASGFLYRARLSRLNRRRARQTLDPTAAEPPFERSEAAHQLEFRDRAHW
jgi:hypothetical protein